MMGLFENDCTVDVFIPQQLLKEHDPATFPAVTVTHAPTGLVEHENGAPHASASRTVATQRLYQRVIAKVGV